MGVADLCLELDHLVRSCMSVVARLGHISLVGRLCFPSCYFTMSRSSPPSAYSICNQPITNDCNVSLAQTCRLTPLFTSGVGHRAECPPYR